MKKLILVLAILSQIICHGQTPVIEWKKTYGGIGNDQAAAIKPTSDGGYIVVGKTDTSNNGNVGFNHGGFDFLIIKTSADGSVSWQKTMGGSSDDLAEDVIQTADGGYLVLGYTKSNNFDVVGNHGDNDDVWLIKLNDLGNVEWKKVYGGTDYDFGQKILAASDGGYIIAGQMASEDGDLLANHTNGDYVVLKISLTGAILWQHAYGGSGHESFTNINNTSDGGYIMCGSSSSDDGDVTSNHGAYDFWVVKITSEGLIQWQTALGGTALDGANDVKELQDGNFLVTGLTASADGEITQNHGGFDIWIVKLNSFGQILWQRTYGGPHGEVGTRIVPNPDNGFTIMATVQSADSGAIEYHPSYWNSADGWVVRMSAAGDVLWQKTIGGTESEYMLSIEPTTDGGYILAGNTASADGDVTDFLGGADFWVVKLSAESLANTTFTANPIRISPNPSNTFINIDFNSFTNISDITISDLTGKIVFVTKKKLSKIDVSNFAVGIYNVQVFSENQVFQSKFIKQ